MTQHSIGLVGLAVMGQNLALNLASQGYSVGVFNRTTDKVDQFMNQRAQGTSITGYHSLTKLIAQLESPKKIILMVKAGTGVDTLIEQALELMEPGNLIIDGGNTFFEDTNRRAGQVEQAGLLYVGMGISGGEEGALKGPSIMPGGSTDAWPMIQKMFQTISAKVGPDTTPCCEWIGPAGAGHYVKMVHNGIEYGDMQLICESYFLLKNVLKLSCEQIADIFDQWNQTELESYLIEITRDILTVTDTQTGQPLIEQILDTAGQKGTAKWMSQHALELGIPTTLITEAVFARCLSALKTERLQASNLLPGPEQIFEGDQQLLIADLAQALYASKICSYAQGFAQLQAAMKQFDWKLDLGQIALLWRGGCIIRAQFLNKIQDAYQRNPDLENLLLDDFFQAALTKAQTSWRNVLKTAIEYGAPVPAFSAALNYYDGYRQAHLPANLLQAQRDYFGAHTYQRIDQPGSFHTDWPALSRFQT